MIEDLQGPTHTHVTDVHIEFVCETNNHAASYISVEGVQYFSKLIVQRALWLGLVCGAAMMLCLWVLVVMLVVGS